MSLAAFTQPDVVKLVAAAALLCPISYLDHITAPFALKMVHLYLDDVSYLLGSMYEYGFSKIGVSDISVIL